MSEQTETGRTLFPERAVRLLNGKTVVIKPWGMATGRLLTPKVIELFKKLRGLSVDSIVELVQESQTEIFFIIQHTLGYSDEQMDELAYEDMFTLAQAILDVCIVRRGEDGATEGALGKLLSTVGISPESLMAFKRRNTTQKPTTGESPSPSSSSSPKDTTPTESENTPSPS